MLELGTRVSEWAWSVVDDTTVELSCCRCQKQQSLMFYVGALYSDNNHTTWKKNRSHESPTHGSIFVCLGQPHEYCYTRCLRVGSGLDTTKFPTFSIAEKLIYIRLGVTRRSNTCTAEPFVLYFYLSSLVTDFLVPFWYSHLNHSAIPKTDTQGL